MEHKKTSKKDVVVKPAAKAAEEIYTIVKISGETYKKYDDGRLVNTGA